jgi:hypothetical protein
MEKPVDSERKPTQQEQVYEFVKSHGRVFTHELNEWACQKHIHITNPGGRAREVKAKGLIWRMDINLQKKLFPEAKDEIWSVIENDKYPSEQDPVFLERKGQLVFI